MKDRDKRMGEVALRYLCRGMQVTGVCWYPSNFSIAMETVNPQLPGVAAADLVLTIESRWTVFPTRPDHFPEAGNMPEPSLEERVTMLARLAGQDIVDATFGDQHPHLILTFESGNVFFLNGYHDDYECWNLATVDDLDGYKWLIVAVPGSAVGLFIPNDFARLYKG